LRLAFLLELLELLADMNLTLLFEHKFRRDSEGVVFSTQNYNYSLFEHRYLTEFGHVNVMSRVIDADESRGDRSSEGERVSVTSIGAWSGVSSFIRSRRRVKKELRSLLDRSNAVILVVPSALASVALPILESANKPFAVEVVGDPYDVFSPGANKHPLRLLFQWYFSRELRRICSKASGAAYVTEHQLQRRYPPAASAFSTHYSSIQLDSSAIGPAPRRFDRSLDRVEIVSIGTMDQMYKGFDTLLKALSSIRREGLDARLTLIGDGRLRTNLEKTCVDLGLAPWVTFTGRLPAGEEVRKRLDAADIFVLASRQEGLPRVIIEAMARGLPCIATNVGGTSELLDESMVVSPNDPEIIADRVLTIASDPQVLTEQSRKNLSRAHAYHIDVLSKRRSAFYRSLIEVTEKWSRNHT
jgi:glycosyltransferase involved in cell wall biosynthesis